MLTILARKRMLDTPWADRLGRIEVDEKSIDWSIDNNRIEHSMVIFCTMHDARRFFERACYHGKQMFTRL